MPREHGEKGVLHGKPACMLAMHTGQLVPACTHDEMKSRTQLGKAWNVRICGYVRAHVTEQRLVKLIARLDASGAHG
jgi:hypothetical protein